MTGEPFSIHRSRKSRGMGLPHHAHEASQLTFAASGMLQIHTDFGRWLVPPQLAAWVPAGTPHRVEVVTDGELWIVHWRRATLQAWSPPLPDRPFALRVTPLLRSLLDAAFTTDIGAEKSELVVRLMLHELTEVRDAPTFLPLPASPLGRRVAELALDDHQNRSRAGELASRAATSVRSLSRLFPAETGLTFKAWRQRARIVHAMGRLARGDAIAAVAAQTGFTSTAAFSSAFRQVTNMTPTAFIEQPR